MTPENAASAVVQPAELTPENAELLAEYADHLEHAPLSGHTPRTYLGAVRAYLTWLQAAEVDGDPLNDATAKDWAVRDYRAYLVTVAKRATATVNKHLAALQDFYVWRGLGQPQGVKRHQVARHAPKALEPEGEAALPARRRGVAERPGQGAGPAAAVRRYPHRRDPRPGRRRRAPERPQGRDSPRRQGREEPYRARSRGRAPRGPGRVARRTPGQAWRRLGRAVHLGARYQDDHRRDSRRHRRRSPRPPAWTTT